MWRYLFVPVVTVMLAVLLASVGCNPHEWSTVPVSGVVTVKGKPVPGVMVTFQPLGEGKLNTGPGSFAYTDSNGEYKLKTFLTDENGAVVGKGIVRIRYDDPDDIDSKQLEELNKKRVLLPPNLKPIEFEVPEGGTSTANFEL